MKLDEKLFESDPSFALRFEQFTKEVEEYQDQTLEKKDYHLVILSTLLGLQSIDLFQEKVKEALAVLSPVQIKEVVYQGTAYLGIGRTYAFLKATNEVFKKENILLPLEETQTTTLEDRREKGTQVQVDAFGERMKEFYHTGPKESVHINYFLASNCFGDYYTRKGLDLRERELITFCYLMAQGGCEPQLTSHAKANMGVGNDKAYLIRVITQALPYMGYPRTLNALACINNAAE